MKAFKTVGGWLKQPTHWVLVGALCLLVFDMFVRPINAIEVSLLVIMLIAPLVPSYQIESLEIGTSGKAGLRMIGKQTEQIEATVEETTAAIDDLPAQIKANPQLAPIIRGVSTLNAQLADLRSTNNALEMMNSRWGPLTLRTMAKPQP